MLHSECNSGKVAALEALHLEYIAYVRICVQTMLDARRLTLPRSEKQSFFPRAKKLTSQIEKNARDHAIQIVSTWAKSVYVRKLKAHIRLAYNQGEFNEDFRRQLYTVGKYLVHEPKETISLEAIDL